MNRNDLKKRINEISNQLIVEKGYICSLDVLCELDIVNNKEINDWRFGKIPYLEKVCRKNLNALKFINLSIKRIAKEKHLKPSWTGYNKYGKGPKTRLIFSKSGIKSIERAYATHYVDVQRVKELKHQKNKPAD